MKRFSMTCSALLISLSVCSIASASETQCPSLFYQGQAPDIVSATVGRDTVALCNTAYSTLYSGVTDSPLYSADVLTTASVEQGRGSGRHGTFHTDTRLNNGLTPNDFHAPPGHYYDRGHMVPNSDMPTAELQSETFLMSNMIVQSADNNEILHEGVEATTRNLAERVGTLYVVTGPIFHGVFNRLNGKAMIPTLIFKAVYNPSIGASAYVELNKPGQAYSVVSIQTIQDLTGINVFPTLDERTRNTVIALPAPAPGARNRSSRETTALGLKYQPPYQVPLNQLIAGISSTPVANDQSQSNTTTGTHYHIPVHHISSVVSVFKKIFGR